MSLADYQSALVTGASSGIGAAVVRNLRRRGLTVHALVYLTYSIFRVRHSNTEIRFTKPLCSDLDFNFFPVLLTVKKKTAMCYFRPRNVHK